MNSLTTLSTFNRERGPLADGERGPSEAAFESWSPNCNPRRCGSVVVHLACALLPALRALDVCRCDAPYVIMKAKFWNPVSPVVALPM